MNKEQAMQMRKIMEFGTENLTDAQALEVSTFVERWNGNSVAYKAGKRVSVSENGLIVLYRCNQDHVSQELYKPSQDTASLWTRIDAEHAGTLDDPIPAAANMEYEKGKYYSDDGKIYLMNRDGMNDGETVILQFLPSQLVDQYFVEVTE